MKPAIKLSIGTAIPSFSLINQDGQTVDASDFAGKIVVVYFYPKALTPGCTTQACGIRDSQTELAKRDIVVLGVSPDSPEKLTKFKQKYDLNFDLLSDQDHALADIFGIWGPKKFMGKVYDGIHRSTFIFDRKGNLAKIMYPVKTKSHHEDIIQAVSEIENT